jgi:hypothetical protein
VTTLKPGTALGRLPLMAVLVITGLLTGCSNGLNTNCESPSVQHEVEEFVFDLPA